MVKFNRKAIILSALSFTLATGALLVGCSNNSNTTNKENSTVKEDSTVKTENTAKEVDFAKLGSEIENSSLLTFGALSLPVSDFAGLCDVADKIEDGYASSAAISVQFQQIAVVKTSDTKAVTDALENYLKSDAVRPYADGYGNEANITSIQEAKIGTVGDYVYFVAAPNSDKIEDLILSHLQ